MVCNGDWRDREGMKCVIWEKGPELGRFEKGESF